MPPGHHDSHSSSYGNDSWMGLGGYPHSGPQHESQGHGGYHGFDYTTSTPMAMEPSYTMARPPPYAPAQHSQMPPPLVMPQQHIWPSMIATSSNYPTPILPAIPIQTPVSATSVGSDMTPTSAKASASRRKLTDDERRLMCLEAENNPTMKQTQIGAKFNVERSTVSKILRQKDKYMKPQQPKEEVTSPGKKPKVKLPDVEKTLANWARNQQKKGQPISTEELRKRVLMFTSGRNDQQAFTSTVWLDKFRQKYLSGNSRSRTRENTVDTSTTHSDTLYDSPTSSSGLVSPPMSAIEDSTHGHYKSESAEEFFEFDSPSLPHGFSSDMNASSEALMSPLTPELKRNQLPEDTPSEMSFPRQRSMTLPHLAPATTAPNYAATPAMPPLPVRTTTTVNEHKRISVDPRSTMKRHKSVPDIHDAEVVQYSNMRPPPVPRSADISPVSISSSPSHQDETIRALHNIKMLLEQNPDVAEPDDYVMIGKLMEKLKLLRSPTNTPILPGGMHPIEMMDSPRLSKKRTVVEMSM